MVMSYYTSAVVFLAIFCGLLNSYYIATLFENDRFFSQLSTLEREMSFRTEMGLYYSYFKSFAEAEDLEKAVNSLVANNHTQYPSTINTLENFNLYPELVVGLLYRSLKPFIEPNVECWQIQRGDDLPMVSSCEGLGVKENFYVASVFSFNSLVGATLFLFGALLSQSVFGGFLTVSAFFFNHAEATRVQWTPPLRESWGYPLFLIQMLLVTIYLNPKSRSRCLWVSILLANSLFILSWQFAQFVLLTQILCLFGMFLFYLISKEELNNLVMCFLISYIAAVKLLFWNGMLMSSYYTSALWSLGIILCLDERLKKLLKNPILIGVTQCSLFIFATLYIRNLTKYIMDCEDDNHIWDILMNKLIGFKDFHSLLYVCAPEFDFLEIETLILLCKTLVLPIAVIVSAVIVFKAFDQWYLGEPCTYKQEVYIIAQTICFSIMALLIMRLKLFFTPQLCILASFVVSSKVFTFTNKNKAYIMLFGLLGAMSIQGVQNIKEQMDVFGEYSNLPLEKLLIWVQNNTSPDSVFAGPMPLMANLMLSTNRPIVNHPHYESVEVRRRTLEVYKLFSREPITDIYNSLKQMKVNYAVIDTRMCEDNRRVGCNMVDIWDAEKPRSRRLPPTCRELLINPLPFKHVYKEDNYVVLKL